MPISVELDSVVRRMPPHGRSWTPLLSLALHWPEHAPGNPAAGALTELARHGRRHKQT
jgi:hypothetical protein